VCVEVIDFICRPWVFFCSYRMSSCARCLFLKLVFMDNCNTIWSCDYVASIKYCRPVVVYFQTGAAAHYLQLNRQT